MGRIPAVSRTSAVVSSLFAVALALNVGSTSGCGGSHGGSLFGGDGGASSGGGSSGSGTSSGGLFGGSSSGTGSSGASSSGGTPVTCPSGAQCNVSCSGGGTTSISGKIYDPAMKDPLYNIAIYVPGGPLATLPKGVPTGAAACNCSALFSSGAVASTASGVDGSFKLTNAPVGKAIPLVAQVGKWRKVISVDTTQCADTAVPDKSFALPGTLTGAGQYDDMPDIAVSTGSADTLECLMLRMGIPASEYVAGAGGTGHIHVFSGGGNGGGGIGSQVGTPEKHPMAGAPASSASLWDSQDHLMPYDILLLSCEGGETYDANPPALESYLNAGGRAFASHYHYAWFSGPIDTKGTAKYSAPADWGTALASWSDNANGNTNGPDDGEIVQTLNGSTKPFSKGQALDQWLGLVGALGGAVAAGDLAIYAPRYNAVVGPNNKPSQPWINDKGTANTMYFSFDTPVNAPVDPSTGEPNYCGRAVFSDLHVSGSPTTKDTTPPPGGCDNVDLSPQEKALEFMLFDLSSCVIPDTVAPPDAGVPTVQ